MTEPHPEDAADPTETRLNAMMKMVEMAGEVAQMMAGVKQQFITPGGYSPENAEHCALLLWRTSADAASSTALQQQLDRVTRAAAELRVTLMQTDTGLQPRPGGSTEAKRQAALRALFDAAGLGPELGPIT